MTSFVMPTHSGTNVCSLDFLNRSPYVDGDTFILERILAKDNKGWRLVEGGVWIRLLEVDTPEVTGVTKEAGFIAKQKTIDWLSAGFGPWPFLLYPIKKDSFGRWLSYLWDLSTGKCLNEYLIGEGYGVTPKISQQQLEGKFRLAEAKRIVKEMRIAA